MMLKPFNDSTYTYPSVPDMGYHLILDFAGVETIDLDNYPEMDKFLTGAIIECKATICGKQFKKFEPHGLSILYLLSESHMSIHTWPESKSCAIDFYHCGDTAESRLKKAEEYLCNGFGWKSCTSSILIHRGIKSQHLMNVYDHSATLFKNFNYVHREKSEYQDIRVYDTENMGRIMVLDGMIQITNQLEDNYTIDLTRSVLNHTEAYDHVLLIGAGDMIIPTYLLEKYKNIKKVTVCEIDERVVEVVKKFFTMSSLVKESMEAGRLEVVYMDGAEYVKNSVDKGMKFNAVIIDNTDVYLENAVSKSLFTVEFYKNIFNTLDLGSAFSQQVSDEKCKKEFEKMVLQAGFSDISYIYSNTPEYSTPLPLGVAKRF